MCFFTCAISQCRAAFVSLSRGALTQVSTFVAPDGVDEPLERERDGLAAPRFAIAREHVAFGDGVERRGPREPHGADRLVGRAAVGTRDAAHGDREIDAELTARTFGHRAHDGLRYRAVALDRVARNA